MIGLLFDFFKPLDFAEVTLDLLTDPLTLDRQLGVLRIYLESLC